MATVERKDWINYGIVQAHRALCTILLPRAGTSHSLAHACAVAGVAQQAARQVPSFFTEEVRKSFLAIGSRAMCEEVNCYTVVSLGLQAYITNRCIMDNDTATRNEPADK